MAIVYRSVKGSNLTPTEVDNNFHDVDNRVTTIEGLDLGKSITSIEVPTGGTTMTITYTDFTTDTFVLPVVDLTTVFQGEWQPLRTYFAGDLFTAVGAVYCVLQDHTSGSVFDPNATLSAAPLYQLWFKTPVLPGQTISDATYTTTFNDANTYMRFDSLSGCVITIDETIDYPAWCEMHFRDQCASVGIQIEISTPGSINMVDGYLNKTASRGGVIGMKQVDDTGAWDIFGLLATV